MESSTALQERAALAHEHAAARWEAAGDLRRAALAHVLAAECWQAAGEPVRARQERERAQAIRDRAGHAG